MRRKDVRRLRDRLPGYGEWPLSAAPLATTRSPRPRVVLRENGVLVDLLAGEQTVLPSAPVDDVPLRFATARR